MMNNVQYITVHWATVCAFFVAFGRGMQLFGQGDYTNGAMMMAMAVVAVLVPNVKPLPKPTDASANVDIPVLVRPPVIINPPAPAPPTPSNAGVYPKPAPPLAGAMPNIPRECYTTPEI